MCSRVLLTSPARRRSPEFKLSLKLSCSGECVGGLLDASLSSYTGTPSLLVFVGRQPTNRYALEDVGFKAGVEA